MSFCSHWSWFVWFYEWAAHPFFFLFSFFFFFWHFTARNSLHFLEQEYSDKLQNEVCILGYFEKNHQIHDTPDAPDQRQVL